MDYTGYRYVYIYISMYIHIVYIDRLNLFSLLADCSGKKRETHPSELWFIIANQMYLT